MQYLPQNSRNFLNFAALAPGLRVADNEFRKEVTSGALPSQHTNVFIDGVSFKNDLILGGVVGQDASRGSPFPQNAVQEFQVLTQNFKAEYEKASSAVITAITRSGGNDYRGEVFSFYQDKGLVQNEGIRNINGILTKIDDLATVGAPKPTYERWQWGASLGGPIVRDRLQFFGSYEENRQDRDGTVLVGTVTGAPQALVDRLRTYEGTFTSPFRENLLFGKLSFQPRQAHQLQVTYNFRNETDVRGFGGQGGANSFQTAENVRNRVDSIQGKYQTAGAKALNETYLSYQRYRWNPTAENYETVGENFSGLLRIGGRDTNQRMVQARTSLRHDHTRFLRWRGAHTAKIGGVASFADYDIRKELNGNPLFTYVNGISWNFPARAAYGVGDPDLSGSNWQFGVFAQDDWAITPRLTVNLGLRWDYETGMINTDYVTPETVRTALGSFVDGSRYFTDGDDRSPFYGALQPRVGFSYDLGGNGRSVAFGGFGRYYDRVLYDWTLAERARLQYATRTFQFSRERRHSRRRGDDRLEPVVLEPRGTRLAHRARPRARARSAPDGQRGEAAGVRPVVARPPPEVRHHRHVRDLQRHAHAEHPDLHSRQPPSRRHLLPVGPRLLGHHRGGSRRAEGVVRRPLRAGRAAVWHQRQALGLQLHLHAGRCQGERRRSVQPRLPDGGRLSDSPDQHR